MIFHIIILLKSWNHYIVYQKWKTTVLVFITHTYKEKLISNLTCTFGCTTNYLHFLYNLRNLSMAFLFACNSSACITEPDLATKKEELSRTFSIYITDIWSERVEEAKPPFLFLSLTLFKIHLAIFEHLVMSK